MTRDETIDILVQYDLAHVLPQTREALLLDWWSIDGDDPEYNGLPDSLKAELGQSEVPDDATTSRYDPLLRIALRQKYVGVVNSFLEMRLRHLGHEARVEGTVEMLVCCPCCEYRTLAERGGYDICPVCFWEDDGSSELDRVSDPNHMTLREARENFARLGAVTDIARKHVLPDGNARYVKCEC